MRLDHLDQTHLDCLAARDEIRREVRVHRYHVSIWQPRPMPDNYRRSTR